MRSTLTINNNEMTEMKVTVRIFDVEGYLNATSTQTIRSHKIQNIAIDDLTKASASPAQSGNVQITYEGHAKGITGQLGSVSLEGRMAFDSRPVGASDLPSSRLVGIAYFPGEHYDGFAALTNVTSTTVHVTVPSSTSEPSVLLGARQTRILKVARSDPATLVVIEHDGAACV